MFKDNFYMLYVQYYLSFRQASLVICRIFTKSTRQKLKGQRPLLAKLLQAPALRRSD